MEFDSFLELVPKIRKVALPGESAHAKMSPPERRAALQRIDWNAINPRQAAVLALFYPKDGVTHLVLIVRNSYEGVHSAQIGFPGGKVESFDTGKQSTALRETREEIGLDDSAIELVCALSEVYIPPSNFLVAPFLAIHVDTPAFVPDPREVAEVVELPLAALLDERNVYNKWIATSYSSSIEVPVFDFDGKIVWGATAMMLGELKEVLRAAISG